jgi:hypothetical protein
MDWEAFAVAVVVAGLFMLLWVGLSVLGASCPGPPSHPWRDRTWLKDGKVATKFREWFR